MPSTLLPGGRHFAVGEVVPPGPAEATRKLVADIPGRSRTMPTSVTQFLALFCHA